MLKTMGKPQAELTLQSILRMCRVWKTWGPLQVKVSGTFAIDEGKIRPMIGIMEMIEVDVSGARTPTANSLNATFSVKYWNSQMLYSCGRIYLPCNRKVMMVSYGVGPEVPDVPADWCILCVLWLCLEVPSH